MRKRFSAGIAFAILPLLASAGVLCDPPFLLSVSDISYESAVFDWTPTGSESEWDIALIPAGGGTPLIPTLAGITSHPVAVDNLTPGTPYDFYVRAVCGGVPGAWAKLSGGFVTDLLNPSACNLNLPIPDDDCFSFDLFVSNAPGVQLGGDVYLREVQLILAHEWDDDLDIRLQSPTGQSVWLLRDHGGNGNNFGVPADTTCTQVLSLINEIAPGACNLPGLEGGTAPFAGQFLPDDPLTALHDLGNPNGVWTLEVCDDAVDDTGALFFVSLIFESIACAPPSSVTVVSVDSTEVNLDWTPGENCAVTLIEYGPPGFTPGAGALPGAGGTVVPVGCPPLTLSGLDPLSTFDIYIREACLGGDFSANSCPATVETLCAPGAPTISESFNGENSCSGACEQSCPLQGSWFNGVTDDIDWLAWEGSTPTPATGPSDDLPGGGKYLYIEGSGTCAPFSRAELFSPCILVQAPDAGNCHFSFDYHLYGSSIATLALEISLDGGLNWTSLWSISGEQGDAWYRQYIDLSAYDGQIAQFRMVGQNGTTPRSDMAIDNLRFYGSQNLGEPEFVYFEDADGDGFGNPEVFAAFCSPNIPAGFVSDGTDCNDDLSFINPGIQELPCNGLDENCNGDADEFVLPAPGVSQFASCSGDPAFVEAFPNFQGAIAWYDAPVGGQLLDTGLVYFPSPVLVNSTDTIAIYIFYAEEILPGGCVSGQRGEAKVLVYPRPDLFFPPGQFLPVCAGTEIDLGLFVVQDLLDVTVQFNYHSELPPSADNLLDPPLVSPVSSGFYYVQAITQYGCASVDSIPVLVKANPIAQINGPTALCQGESATLEAVDAGPGFAPYDYSWNVNANDPTLDITANGPVGSVLTYSVTLTDAQFCTDSDTLLVEIISSLDEVQVIAQQVSDCGLSDGSFQLTPVGGTGPFDYSWSGPVSGSLTGQVGPLTLANLPEGAYSVTITDSSPEACPFISDPIVISAPQLTLELVDVDPAGCFGESSGCITIEAGGTNPLIEWSQGTLGQEELCGLAAGLYSVTVSEGSCELVLEDIEITEPDSLFAKTGFLQHVDCPGASTGMIVITASGGQPPYSYDWSSGQTTAVIDNIPAGTYFTTVSDAAGCEILVGPMEVEEPPAFDIQVFIAEPNCFGEPEGAIEVDITGGTGPYSFLWSNGSQLEDQFGLTAGNYNLTLTDSRGCEQTGSYSLAQPPELTLDITSVVSASCQGVNSGAIFTSVNGGVGTYAYAWSNGTDQPDASGLSAGTYTLTVTDGNGCTLESLPIEVMAPDVFSMTASFVAASCLGATDGSITLLPVGGQNPFDYQWETGASGPTLTGVEADTYSVIVTDNAGCTDTLSFDMPYEQPIEAVVSAFPPNCADGANGIIFLTPMGGQGPYSYSWNTGEQGSDLTDLPAGEYACTISDNNGCLFYTDTISLFNPSPIVIEVESVDSVSCAGASDGSVQMTVSGGVAPYLFTWNTEATTEDLSGTPAGVYILTVADSLNCAVNGQAVVLSDPDPLVVIPESIDDQINCTANTLDTVSLLITGGTQPYSVLWSDGSTNPFILGNVPGDYSATVTDAGGCTAVVESVKIPEPHPFLEIEVTAILPFTGNCADPGEDGSISVRIEGGIPPYEYNWSQGLQGTSLSDTLTLTGLTSGSYQVTITDQVGCSAVSEAVNLVIPDPLSLLIGFEGISPITCFGEATGAIDATANGGFLPYFFLWTNAQGDTVALTEDLTMAPAGVYSVQVWDQVGCTQQLAGVNLSQPTDSISASIFIESNNCFGDTDGIISANIFGGSAPYSYLWNTGDTVSILTDLAAGFYSLTVEDFSGCSFVADSMSVSQPDSALQVDAATVTDAGCANSEDGSIDLDVSGGTEPYFFFWNTNDLTEDLPGVGSGQYSCQIVDINGCQFFAGPFEVQSPPPLAPEVVAIDSAMAFGDDGAIEITVSGGVEPYLINWSNGDTGLVADMLESGWYTATITDDNQCWTLLEVFVPQAMPSSSVQAVGQNFSVQVFPNPASERVWVKVSLPVPDRVLGKVWTVAGVQVYAWEKEWVQEETFELQLPPGVYWVGVYAGRGVSLAPLVVFKY